MNTRLTSLFLAPLLLGGCLLPQPDTPPVGRAPASRPAVNTGAPLLPQPDTPPVKIDPGAAKTGAQDSAAGGANATTSGDAGVVSAPNTGTALAPTAAASAAPTPAVGKLLGKVVGVTLKSIQVTDEAGTTTYQSTAVGTDGTFAFSLAPGRYVLVLTTDKDEVLKPSQVFTVSPGETRTYTVTLDDHTSAVVSEDAPLASPSPSVKP
jgi:hypothetical protein